MFENQSNLKVNMKLSSYITILFLSLTTALTFQGCDVLEDAADSAGVTNSGGSDEGSELTNSEVISGLKKALNVGINNAVDLTSKTDGFLKNLHGLIEQEKVWRKDQWNF